MLSNPDGTLFRDGWGWTSYRRTGWVSAAGIREYRAHFRSIGSPRGWSCCTITFLARRPRLALRHIVSAPRSYNEILAFDGLVIN